MPKRLWNGFREWWRDTSSVFLFVVGTLLLSVGILSVQTAPRWLEVLSLVVAVDAAILASWETRKARKLVSEQVGFLVTRHIEPFPACIDNVIELIQQARKGDEIRILCDVPGYGIWSDPKRFQTYFQSMIDAHSSRHVKISVIVATGERRRQRIGEQFYSCFNGNDPDKRQRFEARLKAWNQRAPTIDKIDSEIQFEQFCDRIGSLHDKLEPQFPFELMHTGSPIPLNLWIRTGPDHHMSIFTITAYGRGEELAFETRAAELVSSFRDVWEGYRSDKSLQRDASSQRVEHGSA